MQTPPIDKTLRGIHQAICMTRQHLEAYREETTQANINGANVPDTDYYDIEADHDSTDALLNNTHDILAQLAILPNHPAYEAVSATTHTATFCTRRVYNFTEAVVWTIVARELAELLPDAPPELADMIHELAGAIDEHGDEFSPTGGIGVGELDQAYRILNTLR